MKRWHLTLGVVLAWSFLLIGLMWGHVGEVSECVETPMPWYYPIFTAVLTLFPAIMGFTAGREFEQENG